MKIIELILGDGIFSGIEAISLVSAGAIEEDFITLKAQEIKLAEVSSEKRILMGALLVPNKPIYRKTGEDEYYIYFSKKTIEKASQLYLMNGNQNNATLEHQHSLKGLTLVESWLVQDKVHDKSRKYGLDVPIGTWMGAVKVNNDDVWEEFVKTGKVKGFSIEGYFADKAERPQEPINDMKPINDIEPINDMEMQAQEQLSTIRTIIKEGERIELGVADDIKRSLNSLKAALQINKEAQKESNQLYSGLSSLIPKSKQRAKTNNAIIKGDSKKISLAEKTLNEAKTAAKDLGINVNQIKEYDEVLKFLNELVGRSLSLKKVNELIENSIK